MIDIIDHIKDILDPLGVKVAFQSLPTGMTVPNEYITFLEINANPELEAGDVELETNRLIQLNIWSKSNYHNLVTQVRTIMEQAGFERTFEYDAPYNDGDSHFNKVLRFVFFDEY